MACKPVGLLHADLWKVSSRSVEGQMLQEGRAAAQVQGSIDRSARRSCGSRGGFRALLAPSTWVKEGPEGAVQVFDCKVGGLESTPEDQYSLRSTPAHSLGSLSVLSS